MKGSSEAGYTCADVPITFNRSQFEIRLWIVSRFRIGSPNQTTTDLSSITYNINNPKTNDTIHSQVYLTASNPECNSFDTVTFKVYPTIIPRIEPNDTSGCNPFNVNFRNFTTGGNTGSNKLTYQWNFGDGEFSNLETPPTHTFTNPTQNDKTFPISLTVTNTIGCSAIYNTKFIS